MLTITSTKVSTSKSNSEIFEFLKDLNNLEKLMPKDRMEKWTSTETTCRFSIKNLASIGMKLKTSESFSTIVLESDGKNPFSFTLTIHISEESSNAESYFTFDGEVNMFMKAMVEKPLKKFFDSLAHNLPEALNA